MLPGCCLMIYERAKVRFWASFLNQQVRKFEKKYISLSQYPPHS